MISLQEKVKVAELIIKLATNKVNSKEIYIAWSGGKDSTVLLHIIKTMYKGKIPFKVAFADTYLEVEEIYSFINFISNKWSLKLEKYYFLDKTTSIKIKKKNTSNILKILKYNRKKKLSKIIKKKRIKIIFWGSRADENPRRKIKVFQKKYSVFFVYPILHFSEKDIWKYIKKFNVPFVDLYKKGWKNIPLSPFIKKTNN